MFVSYVVATYNCANRIAILNETIQRLPAADCEFCISDGASSDNTLEAIVDAPNVKMLRSSPDTGIYDAWNQVLDDCRGEFISFIGVDDEPTVEFLEAAKNVCAQTEKPPVLIYGDRILKRERYKRTLRYSPKPALFESNRSIFDIPHQAALNHRSLFHTRKFDTQFQLAGDLEFYIALRDVIRDGGYQHLPIPQVVASEDGLSRSAESFPIYLHEFRLIEERYNIELGYNKYKLRLLSELGQSATLFRLLKDASWIIRHDRA
jgi:glycosyltransferase involved in cell wall biosynthesis